MSLSSEEDFDYEDWLEEQDKLKRKQTRDLDVSSFEEAASEALHPAKKVKYLKKHDDNALRPVVYETPDFSEDAPDIDPNPAFKMNAEAFRRYEEHAKKAGDAEKSYNFFQLSQLNARKAKIVEATNDPKVVASKEEKQAKNLIALQEAGKPARDEYLDMDSDNIIYLPCKPPDIVEVDEILGPSLPPGTPCFACTHGVGFPLMNGKLVENLEKYIREVLPNNDIILASIQIAYQYATTVQAPTNRGLKKGERPLPDWTPRQVYDCLTMHRLEPSHWIYNTLRELQSHRRTIREVGLYNFDAGILADGRVPAARDVRISKKYQESYFKTIELELKILSKDPKKMIGHNEKMSIASSLGSIIGPKTNTFEQQRISDIFSANKK